MNALFILSLSILIANASCGQTIEPTHNKPIIHHLKWVTHTTPFPIVLQKSHTASTSSYNWFKYDQYMYVTQLPNFKPDYYVSKQKYKSELTIFSYDQRTHEPLTTYEAVSTDSYDLSARELFSLAYLQSHRLRIDRDEKNTAANVTCIADFLVDKVSLAINGNLVEKMKELALFRIDLQEKSAGDLKEFKNRMARRSWFEQQNLHAGNRKHLKRIDRTQPRFKRDQPMETKKDLMNVRLSFGPVTVVQPIEDRLISCNLDLVNAESIGLDYHDKVYKFLTAEPMGMDLEAEDAIEKKTMNQEENSPAYSTPATVKATTIKQEEVNVMSDDQLNKIFIAQERVDQEFNIKEKNTENVQQDAKIGTQTKNVVDSEISNTNTNKSTDKTTTNIHDKRFFNIDDHTVMDDLSNMMFMLDKPAAKDEIQNSATQLASNYTILILIAVINAFFY